VSVNELLMALSTYKMTRFLIPLVVRFVPARPMKVCAACAILAIMSPVSIVFCGSLGYWEDGIRKIFDTKAVAL